MGILFILKFKVKNEKNGWNLIDNLLGTFTSHLSTPNTGS